MVRAGRAAVSAGIVAVLLVSASAGRSRAQESPILSAMRDELTRSMSQLRMKDQPAPYYIEYEVEDRMMTRITARLGALVEDLWSPSRSLRVEVRVGDYAFDNSLFNAPVRSSGVIALSTDGSTFAPLDDDYDAMRRQIWVATDAAYKRAISLFARKKAAFQNRATADAPPDFSQEKAEVRVWPGVPAVRANHEWPDRVRQLSAVFNGVHEIETSEVAVADTRGTRYYVNSEGTRVVSPIALASFRASAEARADDGMPVRDAYATVEKHLTDLPSMSRLMAGTRDLVNRVMAVRRAPLGEEYTGPVLIEGQAIAEIVGQALVPAMLARRPAETPNPNRSSQQPPLTPFATRVGLRVLAAPFSASDTPSLDEFEGRPVAGSYAVDDQGLRPKDVSLVEKGRLMTLLTGRTPLKGLLQSNGHWRNGMVQAGVFQLQSADSMPAAELRKSYVNLLKTQDKPFGYIVRVVANPADVPVGGGPSAGPLILHAARITQDGDEQVVRGMRFAPIAPATFRDLLEASTERALHSYRVGPGEAVSVIVPNVVFEELEVQRSQEVVQRPPVVPSPSARSAAASTGARLPRFR